MNPAKVAIRGTTQEHLDIFDIQDDIIILRDGSCALVIAATAINFDLLSTKEQDATIYAYAGLLNSLTFSIQIIIRSQKKDISSYLHLLDEAEQKETRKLIKEQIQKYRLFVKEIVQKNEVLDKKAYIAIPMSALELGITKTVSATFKPRRKLPFEKSYILDKAKVNLYPKRDHILRLLNHLGLKGRQLDTQELIQLFFNIYNPEITGQEFTSAEQYTTPMVQAPPTLTSGPQETQVPTPQAPEPITSPAVPPAAPVSPISPSGGLVSPTGGSASTPPNSEPVPPSAPPPPAPTEKSQKETNIQDQINQLVEESVSPASTPGGPVEVKKNETV